jgi:hypothetical protein
MKKSFASLLSLFLICSTVQAQQFPALMFRPPQLNFADPLQQAMQIEQIRALRMQNEQAEAQRRFNEEQTRAQERQRQQQAEQSQGQSQSANQPNPIFDEWLKAAAPRMGLYKDFEKVVFAGDVSITPDMIRLMTPSTFAADIAYYLGTNKLESLAISKMTLVEAARSIDRIETQLQKSAPK